MERSYGEPRFQECLLGQVIGKRFIAPGKIEQKPPQTLLMDFDKPRERVAVVGSHAEGQELDFFKSAVCHLGLWKLYV